MKNFKISTICPLIIIAVAVLIMPVSASTTDGTIDSTDKYAWGENIGWINFGTAEGNVHITDSVLTGYAWSSKAGWISLNCSNTDSCATVDYKVANDGAGNLSGYAWGENMGWIDLNPTNGGVSVDSNGEFSGYAFGPKIGWIVFNCVTTNSCATVDYKVKTDWRPQASRPQCNNSLDDDGDGKMDYPNDPGCSSLDDDDETDPGGGLPPGAYNPPSQPEPTPENQEGEFGVVINGDDEYTISSTVVLNLYAGLDTNRMAISNNEDFKNASIIPYQEEVLNYELRITNYDPISNDQILTVYAKFYTQYGVASEVVSDSIIFGAVEIEEIIEEEEKIIIQPEEIEEIEPEIPEIKPGEIKPEKEEPIKPKEEIKPEEKPIEPEIVEPTEPIQPIEPQEPPKKEISEPKNKLPQDEPQRPAKKLTSSIYQKTTFFVGGLWQSIKTVSQNAYQKTVASLNSFNKGVANFTKNSKDKFASFFRDVKIIEDEIKVVLFNSSQPMQISSVKATPLSSVSVEIKWETNHKATSKVNYGFSRIYDQEKQDSKKVKNHSIILNNLKPDTTYHYEVISQNGSYVYDADRIFYTPKK